MRFCEAGAAAASPCSDLLRITYTPVSGRMISMISLKMESSISRARLAPKVEPISAMTTHTELSFQGI